MLVGVTKLKANLGSLGRINLPSILHISDLHRSASDPVDNSEIISSLLTDRDQYVIHSPPIKKPDTIVVSGDIIQGTWLGDPDFANILAAQYEQAALLLNDITERFVGGDRTKIAICAGNHDVCWNTAFAAMSKINDVKELKRLSHHDLFDPDSQYRWNWKEKKAYKIHDPSLYETRLSQYWDFLEKFYKDTKLKFSIDRNRGYNIFEVVKGRVVIAAFNSVRGNDCFAFHGSIAAKDVADCSIALRDCDQKYALKIAVWHHGIYTPPPSTDFMSMDPLFDLANHGFGLGLHGHQHQAAHTVQYIHVPEQRCFPIVSAGSLCAGAKELPTGHNRQYNVIEIADDFASGKVHIRERTKGNIFTASLRPEFGLNGAIDLDFDPPNMLSREAGSNLADVAETRQIALAEEFLRSGKASEAVAILASCKLDGNPFARRTFFEAIRESEDWTSLTNYGIEPHTAAELAVVCEAISNTESIDAALVLATGFCTSTPQEITMIGEIIDRLSTKKMIGS